MSQRSASVRRISASAPGWAPAVFFGGFAGGGNGSGNGGGGGGGGGRGDGGFKGRELVPLSTARPQMPDWACKKKIHGWVEVVFVVTPGGHVENVRIVDADPKGVYEAAAIESVGNWIYPKGKTAAEVKQKVEMDPGRLRLQLSLTCLEPPTSCFDP